MAGGPLASEELRDLGLHAVDDLREGDPVLWLVPAARLQDGAQQLGAAGRRRQHQGAAGDQGRHLKKRGKGRGR